MNVRGWGDELMTVDLGTQSLRLAAYDDAGHKRWAWSAPVDSHIHGDIHEQAPEQWESLLLRMFRGLAPEPVTPPSEQ